MSGDPKAPKISVRVQESAKGSGSSSRVQTGGEIRTTIFLLREAVREPSISLREQAGGGGPGRKITNQAPSITISRAGRLKSTTGSSRSPTTSSAFFHSWSPERQQLRFAKHSHTSEIPQSLRGAGAAMADSQLAFPGGLLHWRSYRLPVPAPAMFPKLDGGFRTPAATEARIEF